MDKHQHQERERQKTFQQFQLFGLFGESVFEGETQGVPVHVYPRGGSLVKLLKMNSAEIPFKVKKILAAAPVFYLPMLVVG